MRTSPEGSRTLCHTVFLGHQLRRAARAADKLTALAGIQFNVVNKRTDRNVGDRKRVSRLDIRIRRRINRIAVGESHRRDNVAFCPIFIFQKRNIRAAVGIILNANDFRRALSGALKVNDSVFLLVSAALMAPR